MNLGKKKKLAMRTLHVGSSRIVFLESRLDEIKEAITKQDINDLVKNGAIIIKEGKGRRKVQKNGKSRNMGNVRKKKRNRKRNYIILTRNLRNYSRSLKAEGKITKEKLSEIMRKIRNKDFKNKSQVKEYLAGVKK
ncbi:MAG: 50S ribosomal protein L19e [Candidatus Pacearchaeota archaeon]|jgi:large subunit ribosomal protein L19e